MNHIDGKILFDYPPTEKKKELITQMQHLIDSKMHASDRSKSISKMHKEWKTLGRSSQNEQFWKEFKKLWKMKGAPRVVRRILGI